MGPGKPVLLAILLLSSVGIIPAGISDGARDVPDPPVPDGEANFSINWYSGDKHFWPSDVFVDDIVYIPDIVLTARNTEGFVVWQIPLTVELLACSDHALYCFSHDTDRVTAIDATNGRELWNVTMKNIRSSDTCKIVAGDGFVVLDTYKNFAGTLRCLEASSGRTVWTYPSGTRYGGLAIQGGRVFASIYSGNEINGTDLYSAFDLATGRLLWNHEIVGAIKLSAPLVSGGSLYYIMSELNNTYISALYSLNCTTGQLRWKSFLTYDQLEIQPVFHGGKLFAVDRDGDLFCVDAEQGKTLWKKSVSAHSDLWPRDPAVGFIGDYIITGGDSLTVLNMTGSVILKFRPGYRDTPIFCNKTTAFFERFAIVRDGDFAADLFTAQYDLDTPDVLRYEGPILPPNWAKETVTLQVHNINFNRTNTSRFARAEVWLTDNGTRIAALDEVFPLSPDGLNTFKFSWNFTYGPPGTAGVPYEFEVIVTPLNFTEDNFTNNRFTATMYFRLEEYHYPPDSIWAPYRYSLIPVTSCLTAVLILVAGAVAVIWLVVKRSSPRLPG